MEETLLTLFDWLSSNRDAIIVTLLGGLITFIIQQLISRRKRKKKVAEQIKDEDNKIQEWRKLQLRNIPPDFERHYPNENYVQPYFTFVEPKEGKKNKLLLRDFFLKEVFINATKEDKLYLLLGDTGTGKTAALVHLYADYINSHTEHDYSIKLLSLKHRNVFDKIDRITYKTNCILLLDAMDENPMAQNPDQRTEFDKMINDICQEFAFVLISCRPQFFSDEASESNQVQASRGDSTTPYTRLRLSDFDESQVNEFLNHVFPSPSDNKNRNKAIQIVNNNIFISLRPLVLTYIKDIVESNREIKTTLDFYDTVVYEQIQREIKKTPYNNLEEQTQLWWNLTSKIALFIFENEFDDQYITSDELIKICQEQNTIDFESFLSSLGISISHETDNEKLQIIIDENIFRQRSMLTRTENKFHFSHKSFYEYFMAYRFFLYPDDNCECGLSGMDFALQIYDDALEAWAKKKDTLFADLKNTHSKTVALSLNNMGVALHNMSNYTQAESYYQRALQLFYQLEGNTPNTYKGGIAETLNNLAFLHIVIDQLDKAEAEFNEVLTILHQLPEPIPVTILDDVATTWNQLAYHHRTTNQLDKAEAEYNEALTIYRQLGSQYDMAKTLNGLADLHFDTNQLDKAEAEYSGALTTYRQLAEKHPEPFLLNVAQILNSLATLHYKTNQLDKAEAEYSEALTTYRQLEALAPNDYLIDVAKALNSLAIFHYDTNQLDKAEEEYNEALTIYHQEEEEQPSDNYLLLQKYVVQTLNNLAILHDKTNQFDKAEAELYEALRRYPLLTLENPESFLPDVAMTMNYFSFFHINISKLDKAEAEFNEALTKYPQLAVQEPHAFLSAIADILTNYGYPPSNINQLHLDKAEEECYEALTIFRRLARYDPDTFLPNKALTMYRQLAVQEPHAFLSDVADILTNYGYPPSNINQLHLDIVEAEFNEALTIFRRLARYEPDTFLPHVALTLNSLGFFHNNINQLQLDKAEAEFNEALTISRQLAAQIDKAKADFYLPNVALILFNISILHLRKNNLPAAKAAGEAVEENILAAESAAKESLDIYRKMAEKWYFAFEPYILIGVTLLERIQQMKY